MIHFERQLDYRLNLVLAFWTLLQFLAGPGLSVAAENRVLSAEEIRASAMDFLADFSAGDEDSLDMKIKYYGKDIILPQGNLEWDYRLSGRRLRPGKNPLTANINVDGAFQRRLRLTALVSISQDVVKVRRALKRGDVVSHEDVELERIKLERPVRGLATNLEEVVGLELKRNMKEGDLVLVTGLRKHPLVEKGDRVLIVAEKGGMKITAPGIVREKGFKDSMVEVLNIQTRKLVFGRVVNASMVKVLF